MGTVIRGGSKQLKDFIWKESGGIDSSVKAGYDTSASVKDRETTKKEDKEEGFRRRGGLRDRTAGEKSPFHSFKEKKVVIKLWNTMVETLRELHPKSLTFPYRKRAWGERRKLAKRQQKGNS